MRVASGQSDTTAIANQSTTLQDDPANVFTRIEVFHEYQRLRNGQFMNVTTTRGIMALGKRFTTRVDIPYVSLPNSSSTEPTSGIGDISLRLLGYKFLESKRSALLASLELSLPTATSPNLGLGRYVITPVVAYSIYLPKRKSIIALTYQEYFSFGGDESRQNIRWTRMQLYHIKPWSRRFWTLLLPELYYDHANGGTSMNLELYGFYRINNRFSFWLKGGKGLYGEHPARYNWTMEVGLRHLIWKKRR
jgi:hypothetical protein